MPGRPPPPLERRALPPSRHARDNEVTAGIPYTLNANSKPLNLDPKL